MGLVATARICSLRTCTNNKRDLHFKQHDRVALQLGGSLAVVSGQLMLMAATLAAEYFARSPQPHMVPSPVSLPRPDIIHQRPALTRSIMVLRAALRSDVMSMQRRGVLAHGGLCVLPDGRKRQLGRRTAMARHVWGRVHTRRVGFRRGCTADSRVCLEGMGRRALVARYVDSRHSSAHH